MPQSLKPLKPCNTTTAGREVVLPPARTSIRIWPRAPGTECLVRVGVATDLIYCWFKELDFAPVGIEPRSNAERQSPLRLDMTDGKAVGNGNAQWLEVVRENLVESQGAVAAGTPQIGE